jgi:hypothetical protein
LTTDQVICPQYYAQRICQYAHYIYRSNSNFVKIVAQSIQHLIEIIKEIERLISEKPAKTGNNAQKFRFTRMGQVQKKLTGMLLYNLPEQWHR